MMLPLDANFEKIPPHLRLSNFSEENKALSKKVVELGNRLKECILTIEEQKDEIKHLRELNVTGSESEKSEDKKKKMQEAEYKKIISELQQKVEKIQSERDASHIQARVKFNEFKTELEHLKNEVTQQTIAIVEGFEQLQAMTTGLSFNDSRDQLNSGKILRSSNNHDLSYATLQKQIIEELGLDNFFSCK
ncbi:hypothetical protein FDP41_007195 [Naegleria fowleri]|uniref:Uncharacterized protein n=1 Tax=Naegleria fowleri TaxID=5763 RepID=A0A6A5BIC6_NAEFO|nr:uncharacterized protein FDP41_007195 [Naegleria fowleri]KAF0973808.1 hypothetical protein FDP41_007195 [Naegleria fowleri]